MYGTKNFEFGGIVLELRLDPATVFKVESALDESLASIFMNGKGGMKLPPVNRILKILHRSNQKSNVTEKMVYDAYIKYVEAGNTVLDLQEVLQGLLEESGFFGKEDKSKEKPFTLDQTEEESIL